MLPRELLQRITRFSAPTYCPSRLLNRSFSTSQRARNVVQELEARGMVADLTSRSVRPHVEQPTTVYLGVDPSARSLHVGNLAALVGLLHFRLQGHTGIALIGGATGSVGDPSGRSTERNALSPTELNKNVHAITDQLTTFLNRGVPFALSRNRRRDTFDAEVNVPGDIRIENNLEWLGGMGLLEFLSTVGKSARISTMLSRESVKSRLESSSGLSFTEFSYQLLQAFDFLTLHQRHGCTIQLGGSDQLGNIMSGIEMIRKNHGQPVVELKKDDVELELGEDPAYGITMPLLTTASGEKFGKSAGNAVWLDPRMTSPFDLYQFFLRTTDEEVFKYLKIFTFIRVIELEAIMADHKAHPERRVAQKVLAAEATELVHGALGLRQALAATDLFYGSTSPSSLDLGPLIDGLEARPTLETGSNEGSRIPSMVIPLNKDDFLGEALEKIVVASGLAGSKTQARKAIDQGTISINGVKIAAKHHQRVIEEKDLLMGKYVLLKMGKGSNKVVILE